MGTNFYLFTMNKNMVTKHAPYSYQITDEPDLGYTIHIAKTSYGWLPLFQAHQNGIDSVEEYKEAYDTGEYRIFDEYGTEYNWEEFDERVLKFNGGILGVLPRKKIEQDENSEFYDPKLPKYKPISHQDYKYDPDYANDYDVDKDGYEFCWREFS